MPFFPGLPACDGADSTRGSRSHEGERDSPSAEPAGRSTADHHPFVEQEEPHDASPPTDP